ncbi:Sensory box protein/GGDEF family protein [Pseudomonas sp. JV551A1]|uniref:Sensory box protein/GGDEF family protein n=1 Tax=Pseudomonas inefficax TaxID=2078786 RepID=A0AAQ1SU78_9PSED|nr:Sensory box protein/GGDEF family protein [Pseudomonas sp. JV551A1]SPO61815.1 Sensory box protein/GGDEF family protein [Pseudomonas inefficax]
MALAKDLEACTVGVGAGMPANTGTAGARHRVAFFAGEPAPTGIAYGPGLVPFL